MMAQVQPGDAERSCGGTTAMGSGCGSCMQSCLPIAAEGIKHMLKIMTHG